MQVCDAKSVASYWDVTSELDAEFVIIGAGIVGLTCAIALKHAEPQSRVIVVERGALPSGASSRNAGFACFGSLTEILRDIELVGVESAVSHVKDRWEGLIALRKLLGDEAIGFSQTGNYELIEQDMMPKLQHMDEINNLLFPIFGDKVFVRVDELIEKFGFARTHISALVRNRFEGQIDSGKMMQSLRHKAQSLGITVRYGTKAARPINNTKGIVQIPVTDSVNHTVTINAYAAAICTNGFTSELLPNYRIKPGRGQILVTAPLKSPVKFDAPCHMHQGYWYFRPLSDNRILIGGGRHLNFEGETTTELTTTPNITDAIKEVLAKVIVPDQEVKIDYSWAGIMGFSEDHMPKIEELPDQPCVVIGFGCNGMGVARGCHTGQKTAGLLLHAVETKRKATSYSIRFTSKL